MKLIKEKKIFHYALAFIIVTISYMIWRLVAPESKAGIKILMGVLIAAVAVFCLICRKKGTLTDKTLIRSVIFAGFVMRIGYMLYTPCDLRSHDLWEFNTEGYGHAGYILTLIEDHMLPQSNIRQYYQQPFFYIAGSLVSAPLNKILGCSDPFFIVDTAKIICCAASCFVLLMADSFCDIFEISGKGRLAAVALTAFHPSFCLSIRITPDMLVAFLMTAALLYTLRWYRSPDWKNTVILAFIYGLAVMTKLSAGAVAIFTAAVFILKLAEKIREHKFGFLIPRFIVFAVISLPLGMWYSIRNYKLFDQEFGYVLPIPDSYPMYIGDRSLVQRFVIPDISNIIARPYTIVNDDFNLYAYAVKSSLFGEFSFEVPSFIPVILLLSACAISVFAIAALISGLKKPKQERNLFFISASCVIFLATIISFIIKYPQACSMDFRYMTYLIIPFAVLCVKYYDVCRKNWLKNMFCVSLILFSVSSCLMYTLIKN